MNKSIISRRDFMNGFALSLAAGSAIAPIDLLAQGVRLRLVVRGVGHGMLHRVDGCNMQLCI